MLTATMKIADKEIVFKDTFVIPHGETLEFTFSPDDPRQPIPGRLTVNVKMKIGTEDDVINAEWGKENGVDFVAITLPNSKNRFGSTTLTKPIKIGQIAGKNLGFYAAFSPADAGYVVTVQFVLGGSYE